MILYKPLIVLITVYFAIFFSPTFSFLLDNTKAEYKDLEAPICTHSICNLGGYSYAFSRSFICSIVKLRYIFLNSKS